MTREGSGKTITSFKTALFLSKRAGYDKVVFLVDRKELDQKTAENFKAYSVYESVIVDDTKKTYNLKKLLENSNRGIIVTTTFKLNYLVKELNESRNYKIQDKKIIFIIDEAHRTTMGHMMGTIKEYFKRNSLFFGFTGTPLFEENKTKGMINKKSELINTTEKLFGPLLHSYTIDEAIQDKNVLGFNVTYINTGEFKSHDDLRNQLIEKEKTKGHLSNQEINQKNFKISKAEIEQEAIDEELLIYNDKTHIPRVVEKILDGWEYQSQNKFFNAILTVQYKKRVIKYYHEFKKQLKEKDLDLNIAMTFSFSSELEDDNVPIEIIEEMFDDYSKFTGVLFKAGDQELGEKNYFTDLVARSTRGGSGRNDKNIDLMIVAEQLLTGYDSKYLNTLYIDRPLKFQNLVQAYSRTNRVFGSTKEFGSIVNFMFPEITEANVNEALKLYGSGGTSIRAIVNTYEVAVKQFANEVINLKMILNDPSDWQLIKDTDFAKNFLETFREASNELNLVKQYYQYKWNNKKFGLTEHQWLKYLGAYKNLKPKNGDDNIALIPELVSKTKISNIQIVDAEHILKLVGDKLREKEEDNYIDGESMRIIYEKIQELSDMGQHRESIVLREFIDEIIRSKEKFENIDLFKDYVFWKKDKEYQELIKFSEEWGINLQVLIRAFENYSLSNPEYIPYIDELIKSSDYEKSKNKDIMSPLEHNIKLTEELSNWIKKIKFDYTY